MQNPFDQFDSTPSNGPVYGPPPAAPKQRDPLQVAIDEERLDNLRNPKPNLPTGYEMGPDGSARLIPGLPRPKAAGEDGDIKLQQKRASLQSLETQINRVEELYRGGLKNEAFGILSSLGEYLPTETTSQFNAAGAGLAEQGLSAFRVPGVGAQSDTELRQFVEANRPMASDYDTRIEEKLRQLRVRVDATRGEMGLPPAQWLGQEAAPAQEQGGPIVHDGNLGGPQLTQSTNGYQTVDNPELSGVRGEYLRRLGAGQGPGELVAFLRQAGINDPRIFRSAVEQANFRRQNPNVPIGNYNTDALDDMDVPLSATESMMNDAAQSPLGAYGMHAGQAASMGTLDNAVGMMGGNAERARIALEDSGNTSPVASTLGDISGSIMGALGGEAALAARGVAPGVGRALAADTAFGAGTGAGMSDDGNRLGGAMTGGLAAGAGSLGGQALMRGVGSAVSPTGGGLSDLYQAGVRPTPGQRLIGANGGKGLAGLAGRVVNNTEEAISSVPIVGSAIRGARQEARDQFQVGAFNQALQDIGQALPKGMKPGTQAHAFTEKAIGDVYDKARSGMRVAADEELANEIGNLSAEVGNLAESSIRRFEQIVKNVVMRRTGAEIDGASYKKIQSELGKVIRGIRKSPSGDGELADALGDLQGILDGAARRHSDPEAVKLLDAADSAYAKFVRIEDASRGSEAGTFTPTQLNQSVRRNSGRVRSKAFNQGGALMQDYAQQGLSLVDRLPNSGTSDRAMMGLGAAGAAGYIEPTSLGVLGALGALYAPGVRKVTTGAMAPRGKKAKALANAMRKRARITGAVGAGVALSAQKDDDQ